MNNQTKLLSIILVSYNTKDILRNCLKLVFKYIGEIKAEIIVVDNASTDGSAEMVKNEFPEADLIISTQNLGFAGGNNLAIEKATGKYFLFLNSDVYLKAGVLDSTIKHMENNSRCGILGVKLVGEDGENQPSARMFPNAWFKFTVLSGIASRFPGSKILGGPDYPWWDHSEIRSVDWVPGAYLLTRKEVVDKVGPLDERYFLYYEETDFCLQTKRAGWDVIFYPYAEVIHLGGESSKTTNKQISKSGKQLIDIRVNSEQRYYWKNYGLKRLLTAIGIEIFWMHLIWIKNSVIRNKSSRTKRETAAVIAGLQIKNLFQKQYKVSPSIRKNLNIFLKKIDIL